MDASLLTVHENKFYADTAGTVTTQQRVRLHPQLTAVAVDETTGEFDSMRTIAPPVGRGWEYLTGTGWDWDSELEQIPVLLAEKMRAPSVEAGRYDLVVDPSNLWLTIHESIGHATELDRALGYEAAYAGTSFATFDQLGKLAYGSSIMNVTGDRTAEHGLATIGYDDEGVEGQCWDLVKDGTLVGYQLDRRIAKLTGLGRSNGCAYADSPGHVPVQRMANVSLRPDPGGLSTDDLIGGVERGHLRGRRPLVVDRHAALQLPVHRAAVLPDRERQAGGAAAGCRLPGDDDGLLGLDGAGRRPADLCPGRRVQLRKGPAGPGRGGLARLPVRTVPRREHPEHHAGGRSMSARHAIRRGSGGRSPVQHSLNTTQEAGR